MGRGNCRRSDSHHFCSNVWPGRSKVDHFLYIVIEVWMPHFNVYSFLLMSTFPISFARPFHFSSSIEVYKSSWQRLCAFMSLSWPVLRKHGIINVVDLVHYDVFFATKVQVIMWIMEHVHCMIACPSLWGRGPWLGGGITDGRAGFHLCVPLDWVLILYLSYSYLAFYSIPKGSTLWKECIWNYGVAEYDVLRCPYAQIINR